MRVIAGTAKRLQLKTLDGMETRPTTDSIKETLRWRQTHPTPEPELLEACEALTTSQQQSEETPALSMTL